MAGGAGQSQTPMGGGSSPLNTGGGMSGGFGGGQQTSSPTNFGPMVNYGQGNGGGFGGGQQNNASLLMYPQNPTPYTGNPNQTFNNLMGGLGGWSGGQQQPQPPQQSLSFDQWKQQPRIQDQALRTPEQQLQRDQQAYQSYLNQSSLGFQQPDSSMVGAVQQYPTYRPQQQPMVQNQGPGTQNQFGGGFGGGQQQPEMRVSDMQYRPERRQPFGGQFGQPMQNPFQPQQPSFMQDPEYQGYQTQANDLQRQMNEYMQKAPMYQQMQDLQNKMAPFQQRYYQQQQDMQRMQQPLNRQRYDPIQAERAYYERMASQRQQPMQQRQFNPYQQQQQYRQPAGIQSLMGMLGGRGRTVMPQKDAYEQYVDSNNRALASPTQEVKRPTMSRADFERREAQIQRDPKMSMDMPYARGFASELPTYFMKKGGKV